MATNPSVTKLNVTKLEDRINPSGFADAGGSNMADDGYIDPGEVERHSVAIESNDGQAASSEAEGQSNTTSDDDDGHVDPGEVERHSNGPSAAAVNSEQDRAVKSLDLDDLASASANKTT